MPTVTQQEREVFGLACGFSSAPVHVVAEAGTEYVAGMVTRGVLLEESGGWDLDDVFWVLDIDGDLVRVKGWLVSDICSVAGTANEHR